MPIRNPQSAIRNSQHRVWKLLKWSLFAVTLIFVGRQAWELWNKEEIRETSLAQIHVGWLALSGVAYAAGWLPSVWFWHRMMRAMRSEERRVGKECRL